MRCSNCGSENPADSAFCEQCGRKLELICPACKAPVSAEARFCRKCGSSLSANSSDSGAIATKSSVGALIAEPIAAVEVVDGERKTVTALFADIKGSMELMEDLDPEEARAIVDPALKLMMDAVHRYGGFVVQSTGDGIFALFGAPVAYEDHPQRALYAALRMQDDLRRYTSKLVADGGMPIEARVGVNTGEVVVRSITTGAGHTEYTPIGHTTNLASRMQAVAPTGSVAVTEHTGRLVEGYFELKSRGPTRLKGSTEPVNVYEVTSLGPLRTRLQRAAGCGLTRFVGRKREMDALKHAAELAQAGHGQVVAVMADPGVGKSRLFYEFKATCQASWMVLEALSVSYGKVSAYLPVIDLLRNYFRIANEDNERERREKVNGHVLTLDRALEDTIPYLFDLLGIVEGNDALAQMSGRIKKGRTLDAIKRILVRESLNRPLMLIFEDLHWIDEQTQELFNLLADSIGSAKVLLLVNYRPEYSHQWNSKTYYTQLRLDPLGKESAEDMLSALLGDGKDLIPLKRLIIERTEGTPFFMEEMVQTLFEDGVVQRNGAVKLARSMNTVKVPTTVQAVLASRIDRLPAEEKELLQTLAVLGREFSLDLAQRVALKPGDELESRLSRLQAGEFIYEQLGAGALAYIFKHALTQEVAYGALLVERRKLLHERAGAALESMFAGQLDEHLVELAYHYSRTDNVRKAIEYLERAGQQALQRSAYADAIDSLNAGLNLIYKRPDSPETIHQELRMQLALGAALFAVKGFAPPEAERAYDRARVLCDRLGDPPEVFPTLFGLCLTYLVRGELPRSAQLAEQLLRQAQSWRDRVALVYALMARGVTSYWMGEFTPTQEYDEALALYDPERHRSFISRYGGIDPGPVCLSHAGWTLWQAGYPDQALKKGDEALALAQKSGHPFTLAYTDVFVGMLHQSRRDARAALDNAQTGIARSTEHGFGESLADAISLRGWALAMQGFSKEGITQLQEGLVASRANGYELMRPYFLTLLADSCIASGRLDEGQEALTSALAVAKEHADRHNDSEIYRLKGELLLRQGDLNGVEAQNCFEHAIKIARRQHAKSWELRAMTSFARLLDRQGRCAKARTMLADIYDWFTEGFDTADLKEAKALLDHLG
jgi:class 3 adenylate cyclase/predicted ATPase